MSTAAKPRLLVRSRTSPKRHSASLPRRDHLWALSNGLPCPQRKGGWTRRGGQGERSPPPPFGTPPATCPLKRRGAVARDAPLRAARATSPQNSGRHRLVAGNSVGMPALAGLRESGAPHRLPGISADKPSKEALHRRPIGETQAKAHSVARLRRSFCQNGGLASANRGEYAARQRPYRSPPAATLVQKAPKTALGRAAAPTQVHGAQLRRRMRRRKGDGDVREPQGDDVAQAGRDHEAQEQGAARAARDDPDGGVRGVHGRARLPGRAAHEGEPRGEGQHHEDQVRGLHGERLRGRRGRRAPWGRGAR